MWKSTGIRVALDISTYCNAGCPQCHRTNTNGLGKAEWLPLIRWDLETFKKAFPEEEIEHVREFKFCGTWGDPVMCKELLEMCKHVIDHSHSDIIIVTNGSIRSEEWWWDLGVYCGPRLQVIFAVDGIDQEMHSRYRRFTDLDKVLANMSSIGQTLASVQSSTVLFAHNEDHQEEIMELCKRNGSQRHSFVTSDRFERHRDTEEVDGRLRRWFTNEDGEKEYLERADNRKLEEGTVAGLGIKETDMTNAIQCKWAAPRNEVVVNPEGQILPCCYHGNGHYTNKFDSRIGNEIWDHDIYKKEYNTNPEKYNILHTPLSEIINSDWFQKSLPNSMTSNNPVPQCARYCSNRIKKVHQIRSHHDTK